MRLGDDADNGVADGILRADHIVVKAAHQLADLGVGEEAQRHALQPGIQRQAQIVDHTFADTRIKAPLDHIDAAVQDRDSQHRQGQQDQPVDILGWNGVVDQIPHDQRR